MQPQQKTLRPQWALPNISRLTNLILYVLDHWLLPDYLIEQYTLFVFHLPLFLTTFLEAPLRPFE
jgi:hypothetical protein